MQAQIEGQKGVTLFDMILSIFETIVVELNQRQDLESTSDIMEID